MACDVSPVAMFPPYIMSNGTYERIKIFCDTLPLRIDRKVDITVHIWDAAFLLAAGDGLDLKSQLVGEPD